MKKSVNFIYLFIGGILLLLSWWNPPIPIALWLAPVFLIRFTRSMKPLTGLLMLLLVSYSACLISIWQRMIPLAPYPFYIDLLITLQFIPTPFLPYLADRLMSPRLKDIPATLVFPLTSIAVEMFNYYILGATTGGIFLEKFFGELPFQQLLSITGQWGLIFLLTWLGPIINLLWERKFNPVSIKGISAVYAILIISVLLFGSARLSFFSSSAPTTKIASITSTIDTTILKDSMPSVTARERPPQYIIDAIENKIGKINKELYDETRKAAMAGANIVMWNELATIVDYDREKEFIETYRNLARESKVYIFMCMAVVDPNMRKMAENLLCIIDPSGTVIARYRKRHLVPMLETALFKVTNDPVPIVKTPYGTIAAVICYDGMFHDFVRRAAKGVDIMLNPSLDWERISPSNSWRFTFRAAENGFSFVRCTGHGLSVAVDYQGSLISSQDYFRSNTRIMFADVPSKGVNTLYTLIGDLFGWICVLGFFTLVVLVVFHIIKERPRAY